MNRGIFTRWSTDCAGDSSRAAHRMGSVDSSGPGPGGTMTKEPPSMSGTEPAQKSSPSVRSLSSAVLNMHWLELTRLAAISSPVRSLTSRTW
jgi:hypothetical protein